jgi:DNA-binding protein HU-beta
MRACRYLRQWRANENATSGELDFRKRSNMAAAAKMTQSQLIKKLAETVGVPTKVAKAFTTAYADMAIAETKKNGVTVLPGIGRLVRVDRKARMGRNPATGEAIKIPAKKVVKFRVAKAVKDAIVPPKKK